MSKEFKKENRYYVLKREDVVCLLPTEDVNYLEGIASMVSSYRDVHEMHPLEVVVVESSWPEYSFVWNLIKNKVTGGTPLPVYEQAPRMQKVLTDLVAGFRVFEEGLNPGLHNLIPLIFSEAIRDAHEVLQKIDGMVTHDELRLKWYTLEQKAVGGTYAISDAVAEVVCIQAPNYAAFKEKASVICNGARWDDAVCNEDTERPMWGEVPVKEAHAGHWPIQARLHYHNGRVECLVIPR